MKVLRNTSPLFNNYLVEVGPWDVQVLTLLAKPAPGKPAGPGTWHTDLSEEKLKGRRNGGKRMKRMRGRQETLYKAHGDDANKAYRAWATTHWPLTDNTQPLSLLLTTLNFI